MVWTGADGGTMKPEAFSEDGGVLPEVLVAEGDKSMAATSRGCDPWMAKATVGLCAPRFLRDARWLVRVGGKVYQEG
jgi:hypothetical protein